MEHKKFMDIQRIKPDIVSGFEVGDKIVIQEKIDGANAAVRYDAETDSVVAQSRKQTEETQYKVAHIPHAVQKGWYK